MSLDTVELIMRTEEVFSLDLPNEDCERIQTVGDLYRLVLLKLNLPFVSSREIEAQVGGRDRSRASFTTHEPWTPSDVWFTVKGIVWGQLRVDIQEITEDAKFNDDLGCD